MAPAGPEGWLAASETVIWYLQWAPVDSSLVGNGIEGNLDRAYIVGTPPTESVKSETDTLQGTLNGSQLALSIPNVSDSTIFGTVANGDLTLNLLQTNGSLQPVSFRKASTSDYNNALSQLGATANSADVNMRPQASGAVPPGLAAFSGTWSAHGFVMTITNGQGKADWRTYNWCSTSPPPCDSMQNDTIIDGGHATISLTGASGATALGYVNQSSDSSTLPVGSIALTLEPSDELVVKPYGANQITLCGPKAETACFGA